MQLKRHQKNERGFTFVEMLITAAVVTLVFGGLFLSVQVALQHIGMSKAKTGAVSLAGERIEYLRSLKYDSVGTIAGIPSGLIKQNSTTTLNGVLYYERVLIEYIDSPDDGMGSSDTNGILADYKLAKVEYSWLGVNGTSSIAVQTNIVPPGIESTAGGGTLSVRVFDANVLPVKDAQVRVYNNTTTTTIDTIRFTNDDGIALFSGAPAAANYQIFVSKTGYSSDQTYVATTSNPSPITSPVAVLAGAVSSMNFQIDLLSNLQVRTVGVATTGSFDDTFSDGSGMATSTNLTITGDDLLLAENAGVYVSSGNGLSVSTTPSAVSSWDTVTWNAHVPASTTLKVQLYSVTGTSTYTLISDAVLAGNSVGFATSPINISGINPSTYPALALGGVFTSATTSTSSRIDNWHIGYIVSQPSIGAIPLTLRSTKIIGTTPVYKYQQSVTTSATGSVSIANLEWDLYTVSLGTGAYTIREACADNPYTLDPGVSDTLTLTLVASVPYSLRTIVVDASGNPIAGADVQVSRSGYNVTDTTTSCGQTFFSTGLVSAIDYVVAVSATGYVSQTVTDVSVTGENTFKIVLDET